MPSSAISQKKLTQSLIFVILLLLQLLPDFLLALVLGLPAVGRRHGVNAERVLARGGGFGGSGGCCSRASGGSNGGSGSGGVTTSGL